MAYVYWYQKEQFLLDQDINRYWTIFAVESGRFTYRIGAHEGEAGFGDLVVCPPGIPLHRRTEHPLTFHFIQFVWEVEPDDQEASERIGKLTLSDTERLASTYRYMRDIGRAGRDEAATSRLRHMLNDLWWLVEMERCIAEQAQWTGSESDSGTGRRSGPSPNMITARQWLLMHAYEPFSMRELSASLGISPVQLTRQFRSAYRVTPSAFVTSLRIGRACRLLEETTLPLEAIAERCGYENGFYLSRVFSSHQGITPSAYRKLHRV
jgi:AraC-like DNA-binding protein